MRIDTYTYSLPGKAAARCLPREEGVLCIAAGGSDPAATLEAVSCFPEAATVPEPWVAMCACGDGLQWRAVGDTQLYLIHEGRISRLNAFVSEGVLTLQPGDKLAATAGSFRQYVRETEVMLDACAAGDARAWAERMLLRLAHRCLLRSEPFSLAVLTAD